MIYANFLHLALNMYSFWLFGSIVEQYYQALFGVWGNLFYVLLYFGSMVGAEIFPYLRQQDNYGYRSLGASGAVSAVVLTFILLAPWEDMYFFFIPIPIKAVFLGAAYLAYSYYAARKGNLGGIAHDVHFFGGLFGMAFTIALKPSLVQHFYYSIMQGLE